MKIQQVEMTPALANSVLGLNVNNRKIRKNRVAQYASDMTRGQWLAAGDPIRISKTGRLLDGQHRLMAVVESGVTIPMVLISELPDDAFNVIDSGLTRRVADALVGVPDGSQVGAAVRLLLVIEAAMDPSDSRARGLVTRQDVVAYTRENEERVSKCLSSGKRLARATGGNTTAWVCFYLMAAQASPETAWLVEAFVGEVEAGTDLSEGSPSLTLRNALVRRRRLTSWEVLSLIIKSYSAWVHQRPLRALYPWTNKSGAFPALD